MGDENRLERVYKKYSRTKADQIPDHGLFFAIFKEALTDEFKEKLFPKDCPPSRQLTALDFKEAEIRRVNKQYKRLYISTSFAGQLEKDFSIATARKPLSQQLIDQNSLAENLTKQADRFRNKSSSEWSGSELNLLTEEQIAQDRLEALQFFQKHDGDGFKNETSGYAQRVFSYNALLASIGCFGSGENVRGKNSGDGLPSLIAKMANILFPNDRVLKSRDVSTIYNRAKTKIAPANIAMIKNDN
ncbi:MAG: hypothetical protein ABJN24_05145 [Hyphomicrobiales bacterium]